MARFGFGSKVRPGAVLPVLAVAVAAAGVVAGAGGPASAADAAGQAAATAAPSGPGGTWGPGQPVPGLSALPLPAGTKLTSAKISAVTCTTPGNCTAVGDYQVTTSDYSQYYWPFTVTKTAGTWGDAQPVSGVTSLGAGLTAYLAHVSCGAAGYCTAAGDFRGTDDQSHGFLVTESAGTWGTATAINDSGLGTSLITEVTALSCPAAGDCTAVGTYTQAGLSTAFTMDESGGTWSDPQPVPGLASDLYSNAGSVSCAAPGDCTAGGSYTNTTSSAPFLVSESGHTWASAQEVTGFPALNSAAYGDVASVSCPDATDCTAVGLYGASTSTSSWQVFTVDEASGSSGQAQPLSIPTGAIVNYPITASCASAGHCTVAGTFTPASSLRNPEAFAASESSSGNWGTGQLIPGIPDTDDSYATGVSCAPAGDCTITGYSMTPYQVFAAVVSAGGSLGAAQTVLPVYAAPGLIGPACPQSGYCTLAVNPNQGAETFPLLVREATAAAVTLQDWVSMPVHGDEPYQRLVATVTSPAGGTPTGTVTVSSGSTPVCTITLANGAGSCPVAAPAGSYQLTAAYSGDLAYLAATSTATVQVLSPSSIRGLYARSPLPSGAQPAAAGTAPAASGQAVPGPVPTAVFSRAAREIRLTVARALAAVWRSTGSW